MQLKARARTMVFALAFCLAGAALASRSGNAALAQTSTQYLEDPRIKAQRFYDHGQFKECFEFVEPLVLGPEKKNASLQFLYAELLKKYGKKSEAIAHFEEVLKLVPPGAMQKLAQDNLRELRGPAAIQSSARFGGRRGYTGLKIYQNRIHTVFPSSPAALAGIAAGDKIISIDGVSTAGLSVDDISKRIMGLEGTKVVLVVERGGKQYSASIMRSAPVESEYEALNGRKTSSAAQSRSLELPRSLAPA
ncbi:MAG: PDZ domain-containing protein, partial [Cyanobacteria bacterium SZAS TMP-1]|nr:PDZ domain-containing protein [Cyanobacteria bacterium SZAS TMP-1]